MKLILENFRKFINEEVAAVTEAAGPFPSREAMEEFEKSGGRDADEAVLAWLRTLPSEQMDFLRELSVSEATDAIMALYQIDRRFEQRDGETSVPYNAALRLKKLGAPDSFLKEEMDAMDFADMGDEGAGIENIPQPEGEEPIDVLMDVKARLAGMSEEELMQLAADLDGDMVTALRHILSDKMYAPTGDSDMLPQIGDDPRDQSPL